MGGKEDKFDKFDEMGQLPGGYDVALARQKALDHAKEHLAYDVSWLQGFSLTWEIEDARFDEDADCYKLVLLCYPEDADVESKARWEYHIDATGKLYPGTPILQTKGKWLAEQRLTTGDEERVAEEKRQREEKQRKDQEKAAARKRAEEEERRREEEKRREEKEKEQVAPAYESSKGRRNPVPYVIGSVVVVVLIIVGVVLLTRGGSDNSYETPEAVPTPPDTITPIVEIQTPDETVEPTAPVTEPTAPATEPTAPAMEPTAPATEPTAPATEPAAGGPTWVLNVRYDGTFEVHTATVVGEEAIEGTDCYVAEWAFDMNPFRYDSAAGYPLKTFERMDYIAKDTMDSKRNYIKLEVAGMIELQTTKTQTYTGNHGQQYSFGDSYHFEEYTDLVPDTLASSFTDTIEVNVVAFEDITVPAGDFRCYKIEYTLVVSGQDPPKDTPALTRTEWWSAEYDLLAPVKAIDFVAYQKDEVKELASYDPMPEMNRT